MSHLNALLSQMEKSEEDSKQRSVHLFYLYFRVDLEVLSLFLILLLFCSFSLYPIIFILSLFKNLIWDFSRSLSAIVFFFIFSSTNIILIILYLSLLIWSDLSPSYLVLYFVIIFYQILSNFVLYYFIVYLLILLKSHLSLYLFFILFINFHNSFLFASSIFFSCFFLYHRLQTSFLSLHYIFTYIYVYSYIHSNIYIYNHF